MYAIPTFGFALVAAALSPRFQRLGDIVCGTIVVIEERRWLTGVAKLEDPRAAQLASYIPMDFRINRSLARALAAYVDRRRFFSPLDDARWPIIWRCRCWLALVFRPIPVTTCFCARCTFGFHCGSDRRRCADDAVRRQRIPIQPLGVPIISTGPTPPNAVLLITASQPPVEPKP